MLQRAHFAAVIGVLLLAGCGQGATPTSSATAAPPSVMSTAPSSMPASPPTTAVDSIPTHYDPARDPAADLKAALTLAATDHKDILLDFGADWCPDCRVLDKLFQAPGTKSLLQQNYHVVAVDVGQFDRNLAFAARYVDLQKSGIPALAVLTSTGRVRMTTNDGSFANARTMTGNQLNAFLTRWASGN